MTRVCKKTPNAGFAKCGLTNSPVSSGSLTLKTSLVSQGSTLVEYGHGQHEGWAKSVRKGDSNVGLLLITPPLIKCGPQIM